MTVRSGLRGETSAGPVGSEGALEHGLLERARRQAVPCLLDERVRDLEARGDAAQREHEEIGRQRALDLGGEEIPEENAPVRGAGQLEVMLDTDAGAVEARRVEVPLILVQGLSEGIHFAKNAGLDVEKVIGVISKGAAQSWQMENRWKTMNEGHFTHGFAVNWMRKDLAICLDTARANKAHLPVAALVDQFYSEIQSMGGERWDTSSLIALLERK